MDTHDWKRCRQNFNINQYESPYNVTFKLMNFDMAKVMLTIKRDHCPFISFFFCLIEQLIDKVWHRVQHVWLTWTDVTDKRDKKNNVYGDNIESAVDQMIRLMLHVVSNITGRQFHFKWYVSASFPSSKVNYTDRRIDIHNRH